MRRASKAWPSAAVVLALGTAGGWLNRESIFATVAVVAAARMFETPTLAALVPDVVPRPTVTNGTIAALYLEFLS
jgi:hypothetical protein